MRINGYLRTGSGSDTAKKRATDMDDLFDHPDAQLTEDVMLRRGEEMTQAQIDKVISELKAGKIYRPQREGFTSTSMANRAAFDTYNVIFEIVGRKGTRALGIWAASTTHSTENEVTLRHGAAFEIYEVEKKGNQYIMQGYMT